MHVCNPSIWDAEAGWDSELEAILGFTARPYLKTNNVLYWDKGCDWTMSCLLNCVLSFLF